MHRSKHLQLSVVTDLYRPTAVSHSTLSVCYKLCWNSCVRILLLWPSLQPHCYRTPFTDDVCLDDGELVPFGNFRWCVTFLCGCRATVCCDMKFTTRLQVLLYEARGRCHGYEYLSEHTTSEVVLQSWNSSSYIAVTRT